MSLRLDDGHRPHGDAFLAAESAKALCPAALDGDGCTCRFAEPLLHRRPVWRQFRRLTDNRTVDVTDHEPCFLHERDRVAQQRQRIGALPLRVRVGKVLANVAQTSGAEQRIGDRVGHRIGVTMTVQTTLALERHATQDQRSRGVVAEAMNVEPLPDSNHWHAHRGLLQTLHLNDMSPRPRQVVGISDLAIVRVAFHHNHASAGSFHQRGVIRCRIASEVGGAQHLGTERLRRLHRHQFGAVRRMYDQTVSGDLLDRVGHRHAGDRPVGASSYGCDDTAKHVG